MGTVLLWIIPIALIFAIFEYPIIGGIAAFIIFIAIILLKIFLPKDKK